MSQELDLKELERKVYRSQYSDGLADIQLGSVLVFLGLWDWLFGDVQSSLARYLIYFAIIGVMILGVAAVRRWVTRPRLGKVKYSPTREKRLAWIRWIFLAAVLFNALLVVLTATGILDAFFSQVNEIGLWIGVGAFVTLIIVIIAYFKDFPRLAVYGVVLGFAFTLAMLVDSALVFLSIGVMILGVGLVLFVRFLNANPLPQENSYAG